MKRGYRIAVAMSFAAILFGGGAYVWRRYIQDYYTPRNFGVVEPGAIFRSGRLKTNILRQLHDELKLRTIIDLGAFLPDSQEERDEQRLADELGMQRIRLSLEGDGSGDPNEYVRALRLMIDSASQPVLIHCASGAQRTSVAVILYRNIIEGMSIEEAYPESFDYRHEPDDYHLLAYLADNIDVIRASLETGRTIVRSSDGEWILEPRGGHASMEESASSQASSSDE